MIDAETRKQLFQELERLRGIVVTQGQGQEHRALIEAVDDFIERLTEPPAAT